MQPQPREVPVLSFRVQGLSLRVETGFGVCGQQSGVLEQQILNPKPLNPKSTNYSNPSTLRHWLDRPLAEPSTLVLGREWQSLSACRSLTP